MTISIVSEKRCPRCKTVKPSSEWYASKNRYDGLSQYCCDCMKARRVIYMAKSGVRAARQAYGREYYQKNLDKRREQQRLYKKTPRARELAKQRYYENHEKVLAIKHKYRQRPEAKSRRSAYQKAIYADPAKHRLQRGRRFLREFGITLEEYERILKSQNGKCAICREPPTKRWLSIDHCHSDSSVRGLLCARCNFAVGYLKDSPEMADRAAAYLRQHAQLKLVV